jgi:hypothetical protein
MASIYGRLKLKRQEIRLATLEAGSGSDPLCVKLSTVSLHDGPKYEALSYVWGDTTTRHEIIVDGVSMHITTNLGAALQSIRLSDSPRVVWIDAVCINQGDVEDRNNQVPLMSYIYQGASKVLVFLGGEEADGQVAFDFIKSIPLSDHIDGGCLRRQGSSLEQSAAVPCTGKFKAVLRLFTRPWWLRTWVIQEVILSRDVDMLCGKAKLCWKQLSKAHVKLYSHLAEHYGCQATLCPECLRGFSLFMYRMASFAFCQAALNVENGVDMLELLMRYRASKATDPRDRIYGLLGLTHERQAKRFVIDYDGTIEELYRKTVIDDIELIGTLRSISFTSENSESSLDLPTWVPDWSSDVKDELAGFNRFRMYDLFNASNSILSNGPALVIHNHILAVLGIQFDKILQISPKMPTPTKESPIAPVLTCLAFLPDSHYLDSPYISGFTVRDAFWRTLTSDASIEQSEEQSEVWSTFQRATPPQGKKFWDTVAHFQNSPSDVDFEKQEHFDVLRLLAVIPPGRRCFVTMSGYLGLGPEKMVNGDSVWILKGGRVPLVLRADEQATPYRGLLPAENGESRPVMHTLVGDCYVHGIMDGEAAGDFDRRAQVAYIR